MRISDWSSDVCSSDLPAGRHGNQNHTLGQGGTCRDHSIGQHSGKHAGADEAPPDLKLMDEQIARRRIIEGSQHTIECRHEPATVGAYALRIQRQTAYNAARRAAGHRANGSIMTIKAKPLPLRATLTQPAGSWKTGGR